MPEDPFSSQDTPPRTTGGNWRWEPPSPEELQAMMPGYTIERLLGRGGMGAVYKGIQNSLERPVAIKILPPGLDREDATFTDRFKNEAKLMARLNHPTIVSVIDFGHTSAGQLFIVMEYVDGTDISRMIAQQKHLPSEHALAIAAHVCDALAVAHAAGIVHRDIKPANVLINQQGQVKVADFGLAKLEEPGSHGLTKTGMAMGTPDYVAPEALIMGSTIDGRADLYAVGVMLYQMLTGHVPRGAFKPASAQMPGVDPRFDAIVQKAMQMDRQERYQTAVDIRQDLDVILTVPMVKTAAAPKSSTAIRGQTVVPHRSASKSAPQPQYEAEPIRPAPKESSAGMVMALLVVLAVVGGFGWFMLKPPLPPNPFLALDEPPAADSKQVQSPAGASSTKSAAPPKVNPGSAKPAPLPSKTSPNPFEQAAKTSASSMPSEMVRPATPAPSPVASTPASAAAGAPIVPAWLVEARKLGGKVRFFGTGPNGATEKGKAEEFNDVVEVALGAAGWVVRRAKGETHGVGWGAPHGDNTGAKPFGPFQVTRITHGATTDMRLSSDGSYRNVWGGGSQHRQDLAHKDSAAVANIGDHIMALGADGEILIAMRWGGEKLSPPDNFFRGARAFAGFGKSYIAAKPDLPVAGWQVWDKKLTEFPSEIRDVIDVRATPNHVILLTSLGKVFVTDEFGKTIEKPYGKVPSDLGPAIAVRAGRGMSAAQMTNGIWVAWGESSELIEQTKKIGPALDVGYDYEKGKSSFMLWVDAGSSKSETSIASAASGQMIPTGNDLFVRLAQIAAQFQTAYDRDIVPPHRVAVGDLDTKYFAAVKRALEGATKRGVLEEAVKLREEAQRVTDKQPLPFADLDTLPDSLKTLRGTYRAALAKLELDRDAKAKPYYTRYDQLLAAYQTELTQQKRLDDALKVKARRDELENERGTRAEPATASTTPTAPASTQPAASTTTARKPTSDSAVALKGSPWKEAAEWVLSLKGSLSIEKDGKVRGVSIMDDLPAGKFDILAIQFSQYATHDGMKMTDADLARLSPIAKTLEKLYLDNCNITGSGLDAIAGAVKLKELSLVKSPVTDTSLKFIANLSELTRIDLGYTKVDGSCLTQFQGLKNLRKLGISNVKLSTTGSAALGQLVQLEEMSASGSEFSKPELRFTEKVGKLVNLRILGFGEGSAFTDADLPPLAGLTKLEDFSMGNTPGITGTGLAYLKGCATTLKRVNLVAGCRVSDEGVQSIVTTLPNLENLTIGNGASSGVAALRLLAALKKLRNLGWHSKAVLEDKDYALFVALPSLDRLEIHDREVTDAAVAQLAACRKLTSLDLASTKALTDTGILTLKAIKTLSDLNVHATLVTDQGVDAFKKARPEVKVSK